MAIFLAALLIIVSFPFNYAAAVQSRLDREFNERVNLVTIENLDGEIEAQTWSGSSVKAIASRTIADAPVNGEEIVFEKPSADSLKITAKPKASGSPVNLIVYLPASMNLVIKGGKGQVKIKGSPLALSVETDSGHIAFDAAVDSTADLSARAIHGTVSSSIPVEAFAQSDSRSLDGRTGRGGLPVILRSVRGNITIGRDDASRIASLNRLLPNVAQVEAPPAQRRESLNAAMSAQKASFNSSAAPEVEPAANVTTNNSGAEEVIRLEARLINLNVKVMDSMGRPLPTLKREDFAVLEDGAPQDVTYFEPVTAPLNIVLLLDLSGSTDSKMKLMKSAAKNFVDALKKEDRIAVAGFTRRFFVISNFTSDHDMVKERIGKIKNRNSGTAYYDAMWATLGMLDEVKEARKAIVVLTDGVDNSLSDPGEEEYEPKHPFDELIARVQEADASIYPIYLDTEYEVLGRHGRGGHDAYVTARKQLEQLADETGTEMFRANRAEDLDRVYKQVAAELHSLYSMGYHPSEMRRDGKWRKISIKVNREGARARARRGYFAK